MNRQAKKDVGTWITRRRFLANGVAFAAAVEPALLRTRGAHAAQISGFFEPNIEFFSTAFVEYSDSYDTNSDGDLWPSCWADDDYLCTANGDGRGSGLDQPFADIVMNRVIGTPETGITGQRLAAEEEIANIRADPANYNRKPTGMVAVDGNGVRIIGPPGASAYFTSIGELEVYYDGRRG
jgi:hypothetical protein